MGVGQGRNFFYSHMLALLITGSLLALLLVALVKRPAGAQEGRAIDQAAIAVTQTVGEQAGICASTTVIAVTAGKSVYYCVTLRNNGSIPLTQHTLSSPLLGRVTFTRTLAPSQEIALTTNILNGFGVSFALSSTVTGAAGRMITNTITVTSTDGATNGATGTATALMVIGTVGVKVTKTVGLVSGCAGAKGATVSVANTLVYYCVTFQNTGTLPLTKHYLHDPLLNVDYSVQTAPIIQGTPYAITMNEIPRFAYSVGQNITNTVFFTSTTDEGISVSAQDQAFVLVGQPSTALTYTIGSDTTPCGTSKALTIISGRPIYHCLRLTNTGGIPFDTHTIQWSQNSVQLLNTIITQTLQPGQSFAITSSTLAQLTQLNVTANATHDFTVTSRNRQGIVSTPATGRAQVTIGAQGLTVQKYASTDRNVCITRPLPPAPPLNIIANQAFYYCLVITNTGAIPLVRHTFSEGAPLNLSGAFTYTIQPGQRITLTNNFFTSTLGMSPLLGPFNATVNVPGSLVFTSFAASNVQAPAQTTSFQINVTAPTPTTTPPPTPFPTFTPTISPTPSPSPTFAPTLTPTPVVVSFQPTPTPLFGIGSVSTPTPSVFAGGIPGQPLSPLDPGIPTLDITSTLMMQTAEAAATQTALAFIPPPVLDTPLPLPTEAPTLGPPTETPLPTPTVAITPTVTPFILVIAPLPTLAPSGNYLDITAQVFQVSTATLGWIWFLGGSIVFFATAGMFAGLSLQQRRRQRHDVFAMEEDDNLHDHAFEPIATPPVAAPDRAAPQATDDNDDDYWPASLR